MGASHPDVSCSSLSIAYAASCLTREATYHLCKQVWVLENYWQFGVFLPNSLSPQKFQDLHLAVQDQLLLESNNIMEPTGMSEEGMDVDPTMPSPALVAPSVDDKVFEGEEENRSKSVQVTMSQSTEVDARENRQQ